MSFCQLYGMTDDIGVTDKQYLIALTVFFFPYSLFEVRRSSARDAVRIDMGL